MMSLLCCAYASAHLPGGSISPWVPDLHLLTDRSVSDLAFHAAASEIANATTLSYTATFGSYFDPASANGTVRGWVRSPVESNPRSGGMRALLFLQPSTTRMMIAFRGTDLDITKVSGQADSCADAMLFGNKTRSQLPAYCSNFSESTLDYYTAAYKFTSEAVAMYPEYKSGILFTGHSLGASLSLLMSAAMRQPGNSYALAAPAAVFSSGSVTELIKTRIGVNSSQINSSQTVLFANEWDPVYASGDHAFPEEVCVWAPTEPSACVQCYKKQPPHPASPSCDLCFQEAHVFSHYLELVNGPVRPECTKK